MRSGPTRDDRLGREWRSVASCLVKMGLRDDNMPRDLDLVSRHLGVAWVRDAALPIKARLVADHRALGIELSDHLTARWRRFHWAHELSHCILEGDRLQSIRAHGSVYKASLSPSEYEARERSCDRAAAEMLVPTSWLQDRLLGWLPNLGVLNQLAKEAGAPLKIVVERVIDLSLWDCTLLLYGRAGRGCDSALEVYPLRTSDGVLPSRQVESLWDDPGPVHEGMIEVIAGEGEDERWAHWTVDEGHLVVVLDFQERERTFRRLLGRDFL